MLYIIPVSGLLLSEIHKGLVVARQGRHTVPGKCMFCAGPGLTEEHIWPVWSHKLLLSITGRHPINVSEHVVGRKKEIEKNERKQRQGPLINKRLRVVCGSCNGGWMSRLEERTKPILISLIQGDVGELAVEQQAILAQWIILKTMVCEQNRKDEVVFTEEQRHQFMVSGGIPDQVKIWIGRNYSGRWLSSFRRSSAYLLLSPDAKPTSHVMTANKNVQTTAIGMGQLFAYSIVSNSAGLDLGDLITFKGNLIRIWPTAGEKILVPLHKWISEGDADAVAMALPTLMQSDVVIQGD